MIVSASMNLLSRKDNLLCWLIAFLLYLTLYPYFVWNNSVLSMMNYLLILILMLKLRKPQLLPVLVYGFICFWGGLCGGGTVFGIIMICTFALIFGIDDVFLIHVYKRYRVIYVVLIALSMVVFILVSMGVTLPYRVSPPPPRNTIEVDYYIYPFFASPSIDDWRYLGWNRFNGLFDEPGVVGTISFLLLFAEKFNLKKIGNIILLISGLLSFSLFFYLAVSIYGIYFFLIKGNTRFVTKIIVGVILILGIVKFGGNEVFNGYISDRLEWNSNAGTITGNNRSGDDLKQYVEQIRWSSDYFLGRPDMVNSFRASASIEKQIVSYGFITVFLFFLFFLFYSHRYLGNTKEWILFYLVFIVTIYNRPTMYSYERLFMYIVMIFSWSKKYGYLFSASEETFTSPLLRKI